MVFWICLAPAMGSGQVVINEILASNGRTNFDEDGDNEDWVELYNLGATAVSLQGYTISDAPGFPGKWTFPDVAIPPKGYLLIWISGKDRYNPPPESIAGNAGLFAFEPAFIPEESEWRYLVGDPGAAGPPPGWNARTFDDSSFLTGNAGFGYGDGDDFTDLPAGTTTVFIRRDFEVPDPAQLENMLLKVNYDDGFAAYLNGVQVAAANAPAGAITFASLSTASHEAGSPETFDLTPRLGLLTPGKNVLAVAGLNVGTTSSDMSLHPVLGVIPLILHANFKLDREGEALYLHDAAGQLVDSIAFPLQTQDHSYGRFPDGAGSWFYLLTPTPRVSNQTLTFQEPIPDNVEVQPPPGKYPGPLDVTMTVRLPGSTEIRYTTDGSVPTPQSSLYSGAIRVAENTVFRYSGFIGQERATPVFSASYFIASIIRLPILSISMDPLDYQEVHNNAGARGRTSEREAHMEFFDAGGGRVVSTGFGLRLHGGAGRNGGFEIKKAYKAYFRGIYGDKKLHYPIIPDTPVDEFDKLVLRSNFNDSFRTNGRAALIRDQLIRDLHEDMGALVSHGSWAILYVNMQLRGIYNIVERMDEEFLKSHLEGEDWDVIKTGNDVLVGTRAEWDRLRNFFVNNDISQPALYEEGIQMLDLENFTSYMILNMWAQNHDWPHNNWYAARRRVPEGKWMFLCWDAEFGIGLNPSGYSADSFSFTLSRSGYLREIFERLLANADYRRYFTREIDRHLYGALYPSNVLARILRLRMTIDFDIPEELKVFPARTYTQWEANISETETFARARGPVFQNLVLNSTLYSFSPVTAPRVISVQPSRVINTGGVEVALTGVRLSSDMEILFDSIPVDSMRVQVPGRYLVTLPLTERLAGEVTVTAVDPSTAEFTETPRVLEVILLVPEPVRVEPGQGPSDGGETVRITGRYFTEGVRVFFGGKEAASVSRVGNGTTELEVLTPPGRGTVEVLVVNQQPKELPAASFLAYTYRSIRFIRGDANGDALVDISDAIAILENLFTGKGEIPCRSAADANFSQDIDIADPVAILMHLFASGQDLASPFPSCGEAPAGDTLTCLLSPGCP